MNKEDLAFRMTMMLSHDEKQQIMDLWNREYPAKLAYHNLTAFEKYIDELEKPIHMLVGLNDQVVGWATKFERDQARWFVLILSSSIHRQGIGSLVMDRLKKYESLLYAWVIDHNRDVKVNGKSYISPLNFYLKHGFEIISDERLELPTLSAVKISWVNRRDRDNRSNT